jgi:hypothetical protein
VIIGNHRWEICTDCGKFVKLTGWLRGVHLCLTPEELALKRAIEERARMQQLAANSQSAANLMDQLMKGRAAD